MPDPPLVCPYCDEDRQIERDGFIVYCNVCGRISAHPTATDSPEPSNTPPGRETPPER